MTHAPRSRHVPYPFASLAIVCLLTSLGLSLLSARQPSKSEASGAPAPPAKLPTEEEEAGKPRPKKRIAVEGVPVPADPVGGVGARRPPGEQLEEVARASEQAESPALQALLARLIVPFDRLTENTGKVSRVQPLELLFRQDPFPNPFGVVPLDENSQPQEARSLALAQVRSVQPFETLVLGDVRLFLDDRSSFGEVPRGTRLSAAEAALAGALRFHDWARDQNKRLGKSWDAVRTRLHARLREVRLETFQRLATPQRAAAANELAGRLLTLYPRDPAVLEAVATVRLQATAAALRRGSAADLEKLREALNDFEARFPAAASDLVPRLRTDLSTQARKLFDNARAEVSRNNTAGARSLLRTAAALDPEVPGLLDLQQQLRSSYPILTVGVSRLPAPADIRLSPAQARFDSEKYGVELIFEGLYQETPDGHGGLAYHPTLATGPPCPTGRGWDVSLARGVEWATPDHDRLQVHDVAETLRALKAHPEGWEGVPARRCWQDHVGIESPGQAGFAFHEGYPDPRAALTFKLLPTRWLAGRKQSGHSPAFARSPTGSGPFRFAGVQGGANNTPREAVFQDNPHFGRRPGKLGQPFLREVRLIELAKLPDPIAEMKSGRLQILSDVPTAELEGKYLNAVTGLERSFEAHTYRHHRRVHMLAVNHRRPVMQDVDLRRGLSLALDREAILNDVFRAGQGEFHTAMSGPFPPRSWATPNGPAVPLFQKDLARVKLNSHLTRNGPVTISLAYPEDDSQAKEACGKIQEQVRAMFSEMSGSIPLSIVLEGLPPEEFHQAVAVEHRFDLAYMAFDYPDHWYPLGAAAYLDPTAAGRGGRNVTGYLTPGTHPSPGDVRLGELLRDVRRHRDLAGELLPRSHEIHRLFNDTVPFIPLWQLDRHMIFAKSVKVVTPASPDVVSPSVLNPLLLFQGIARWRVE